MVRGSPRRHLRYSVRMLEMRVKSLSLHVSGRLRRISIVITAIGERRCLFPSTLQGSVEVEVLQLRKGKESGRVNDVHAKQVKRCHIEEEWVLQGEIMLSVRRERARILYYKNVGWWPAGSDITAHTLEE